MRKILSVVLALAMVASFGVLAFAEGSPVTETGSTTTEAATDTAAADGVVAAPAVEANEVVAVPEIIEVTNEAGEAAVVTITPISDIESLSEEDQEAFKAAYEEAMAVEDAVVEYFFWISAEDTAVFPVTVKFACENEVVAVTCNGAECEFTAAEGNYSAVIPEAGAVAVLTAIAE